MNDKLKAHAFTALINIVMALPLVLSTVWFIFKPHVEDFVLKLVRFESAALRYEAVSDSLQTFKNIPEDNLTQWHKAEIDRLEERQTLLRGKLSPAYNDLKR